jgi:RNA 2',3'-cyclic 3'-phosphodiesterase
MTPAPTIRAFLAVEVAVSIHAALVDLKRELARTDAAVRWVRDEGLHATVRFLGAVPDATLLAVRAALARALVTTPCMTVAVRGLGVFPTPTRPRIVWVELDCPTLHAVAAAVDAALEPLGFAKDPRELQPHITLGRVTGGQGWTRLAAALHAHRADDFGTCQLADLIAYRSDLRRDGAVYTKLWTVPFGG